MRSFFLLLLSIIFLIFSFFVFTNTPFFYPFYRAIKIPISLLTRPAMAFVTHLLDVTEGLFERYIYLVEVKEENLKLKKELEKMEMKLQRLSILEEENKRLIELLEFRKNSPLNLKPARVIGEDVKGWYKSIIIDKGRRDGIKERMVVISTKGLVGLCLEVGVSHSKVMLINDIHSSVDTVVQGKEIRGIIEGTGFNTLKLKYVSKNAPIENGDVLITSGRDGLYLKDIPVGVVSEVKKEETDIFSEITVMPFSDLRTLKEVFVVIDR